MKKRTLFINGLIAFVLLFVAGLPGQGAVQADSEAPGDPQAVDAMPAPTIVFAGLDRNATPGDPDVFPPAPINPNDPRVIGAVPDTSGAAGHTHFLQAVNESVAIYRKDGTEIDRATFAELWSFSTTPTPCSPQGGNAHHGQPFVLYDQRAARWVVADVAYLDAQIDTGPYYICIAVSNGLPAPATPGVYFDGTFWYYYTIKTDVTNFHYYPDSLKMGFWPDGYYLAADMYDIFNNGVNRTPRGVKVWALNREDLIGGQVSDFRTFDFYLSEQLGYEHLVPSNLLGNILPPSGTPNYFAAIQQGKFHIWEFHVDWNEISPSTFGVTNAHLPNYTINTDTSPTWAFGYIVPQLGTSERVDVHGERLMSPLQYRIVDGIPAMWATHALRSGSVTGMRWYELRFDDADEPFFYQQGTYQPDNRFRWNGSLAVDRAGDMAVGYSVSNASMNPAIRYAGRLKSDPTGQLAQGEAVFRQGGFPVYNGSQYDGDALDDGPWGRQSHMSVDPLDECVFWYTNMYYDEDSSGYIWRTAIGWFSFPQCRGGVTKRISLHTDDTQGNASSGLDFETYSVAISANGRFVAFSSEATNLVDGDTNGHRDVFLRDRDTDQDGLYDEPGFVRTTRLSNGLNGAQSNADSWEVSISPNARYIAYSSDASNLVQDDNNGVRDVFVYDRTADETVRASVPNNTENDDANAQSDQPFVSISANGRFVVFRSYANNLVTGDTNTFADIFLRDLDADDTFRISVGAGAPPVQADGESATPTISNNGQFVAFASRATNLAADGNGNAWDVFLRDRATGTTTRVSASADPLGISYTPFISGNGRYIAYASRANLDGLELAGDYDADIFVYDRGVSPATTTRVSVSFFGALAQNGDSYSPSISVDGRYIAFASEANNLDVNLPDLNARRDIFLHDRSLALSGVYTFGLTQRISLSYNRGEPNDWSFVPVVSQDGQHVAYVSEATNLVTNDTNSAWDVFAFNSQRNLPTFLTIPANIPGNIGQTVEVPVIFDGNGQKIDTTTFSIDYDQTCLSFDDNDPDAIVFGALPGFITYWSFNAADHDGEIDISVYDQTEPRQDIPDGTLLTMRLKVKSSCVAAPGTTFNARVGFSDDPPASFGSFGQSIFGFATDGFIRILPGKLGDCNGDGKVDAGDLSGLVLEIFDGDDVLPENTPGGTFPGNPVGCNPNQDVVVDAGDLSCTVLIIYGGGSAACAGGLQLNDQGALLQPGPRLDEETVTLTIPAKVPALPGDKVDLHLAFDTKGKAVSSLIFSVDYDQTWLSFDGADRNGDGLPDGVKLHLPQGFVATVQFDPKDSDGELDFVVYALGLPQPTLPTGELVTVSLQAGQPSGSFLAEVKSSQDPRASFGSATGGSLRGAVVDGSVLILGKMDNTIFVPVAISSP